MRFQSKWLIAMLGLLLLTGCGRKDAPQAEVEADAPVPTIQSLQIKHVDFTVQFTLTLAGGAAGVGYQVDRAEVDPSCDCPSFWRRYSEERPNPANAGREMVRLISLKTKAKAFVFRIRAIDGLGRLGPWSEPFRAQATQPD